MVASPVLTPRVLGVASIATPPLAAVTARAVQVAGAATPVPGASPVACSASITTSPAPSRNGSGEVTAAASLAASGERPQPALPAQITSDAIHPEFRQRPIAAPLSTRAACRRSQLDGGSRSARHKQPGSVSAGEDNTTC